MEVDPKSKKAGVTVLRQEGDLNRKNGVGNHHLNSGTQLKEEIRTTFPKSGQDGKLGSSGFLGGGKVLRIFSFGLRISGRRRKKGIQTKEEHERWSKYPQPPQGIRTT